MAEPSRTTALDFERVPLLRIVSFQIDGLFSGEPIRFDFPETSSLLKEPLILILQGRNGTGKTTILRMIAGMLELQFNTFRKVPFSFASLSLSNGDILSIKWTDDGDYPLWMDFNGVGVKLPRVVGERESDEHSQEIDHIRRMALPSLKSISYELLELDRMPREDRLSDEERSILASYGRKTSNKSSTIAARVAEFIRDAQLNYRDFFHEEEFGFLPRLLERLKPDSQPVTKGALLERIERVRSLHDEHRRYGLLIDEDKLVILERLLNSGQYSSQQQNALIETYVEGLETTQRARDAIAKRLGNFERIMDEFLIGKTVRVDVRRGIVIRAHGIVLNEEQLSSGEYHFLFMMVAALLCKQVGSIIAIDEPELSLHVSWQRKLISALQSCAAGASPTLLFATHSLAISSEYKDKVHVLSSID